MHRRTRIKVCGITTAEDAEEAIRLGVDAVGFIFAEKSPRYVSPEKVKEIVAGLPPFVHLVGVFVDCDPVEIQEIIDYCGLSHVQLHGAEDEEYCRKLAQAATPCRILKAFRVGAHTMAADFTPYEEVVRGVLLDTHVDGQQGGTGKPFDWTLVQSLSLRLPVVLAGGLTPDNVAAAIRAVRPFAVDVNSGVEDEPGRKNSEKMQRLVEQVWLVDRERQEDLP